MECDSLESESSEIIRLARIQETLLPDAEFKRLPGHFKSSHGLN